MAAKAYSADLIFTGRDWLEGHSVICDAGSIQAVIPVNELPTGIEHQAFAGKILAPAFIDLQIYGAFEKLFGVYPYIPSLELLNRYSNLGGAAFCMPTVATNEPATIYACIDAIRSYWKQGGNGILGLHIEGPWINKTKRGAHIESLVHEPTIAEVEALLAYGKDVIRIITLAPEVCNPRIIEMINAAGIKVFAGHSNAVYAEAMQAFDNGICSVTHLYNAMSPLQHREPGLVGAAFLHNKVRASIIPDGYHVDYPAIRIAKKIMGERLFAITDAVTQTSTGHYPHQLEEDRYTAGGILSGSALTMYKACRNLVKHVGIDPGEALRMCSLYPAQVMNLDNRLGLVKEGYDSQLVCLPANFDNSDVQLLS